SADGKRIAYTGFEPGPRYPIFVVDVEGGPPERVCDDCGMAPAWSQDGTKVVWDIGTPRYVGVTHVETKTSTRISAPGSRGIFQTSFSPDGGWLVAEIENGPERAGISVAPYREGVTIPADAWVAITDGKGFDSRPRWSPDGNRIYFVSDRD